MKSWILFVVLMCFISVNTRAQQALFGTQPVVSPEIHADRSVTFRILAPQANEVKIAGDWMPSQGWTSGTELMKKDEKGIWTLTTQPLESDLYSYTISIDGLKTLDPGNVYTIRDVASIFNVFIVGGDKGDLYKVNMVPHGSVTRRWYDSPGVGFTRRITIYTPPGYESSQEKYPVLYLLHGMGGDEEA